MTLDGISAVFKSKSKSVLLDFEYVHVYIKKSFCFISNMIIRRKE
jgi:hypothetical protein